MAMQQIDHLGFFSALANGHQLVTLGHNGRHRLIKISLKSKVAFCHDSYQAFAADNRKPGNFLCLGQGYNIAHQGIRSDCYWVLDYPAFVLLDPDYLLRLFGDRQILMHNTQATFLGDRYCQTKFGDRIHSRRNKRNIQL